MRDITEVIEDLLELDEVSLLEVLHLDTPTLVDYLMPYIEEMNEDGVL